MNPKKAFYQKTLLSLLGLVFVVLIAFFLPRLLPGDPLLTKAASGNSFSNETYSYYVSFYGYDESLWVQLGKFIAHLFDGTLGYSIVYTTSCANLIWPRFFITLSITLPAVILSALISASLALEVTSRKKKIADSISTSFAVLLNAFPTFMVAMFLLFYFAFDLKLFPSHGYKSSANSNFFDVLAHIFLPILTIVIAQFPGKYMLLRNSIASISDSKYLLYARARGVSHKEYKYHYLFPNAAGPFLTAVGLSLGASFGGSVVIEEIFSIQGMGKLLLKSLQDSDYPMVSAILILTCIASFIGLLLVDIILYFLDPKRKEARHV